MGRVQLVTELPPISLEEERAEFDRLMDLRKAMYGEKDRARRMALLQQINQALKINVATLPSSWNLLSVNQRRISEMLTARWKRLHVYERGIRCNDRVMWDDRAGTVEGFTKQWMVMIHFDDGKRHHAPPDGLKKLS